MLFGNKQAGYMQPMQAVNMTGPAMPGMTGAMAAPGMTYEGYSDQVPMDAMYANPMQMPPMDAMYANPMQMPATDMYGAQTPMGYSCEPCAYCGQVMEEKIEMEKQPRIYVVQKGDSVYKIAQRYGLDWRELAGYNHLANPDLIYPGERLFIPEL